MRQAFSPIRAEKFIILENLYRWRTYFRDLNSDSKRIYFFDICVDAYDASTNSWKIEKRDASSMFLEKSTLKKIYQLKSVLIDMEKSLGMLELAEAERNILVAASDCAGIDDIFKTGDVIEHKCVSQISRPTFFRSIRRLVDLGFLLHAPNEKSGYYKLNYQKSEALQTPRVA